MLKTSIATAFALLTINATAQAAEGDKVHEYATNAPIRGGALPYHHGVIVGNLSGKVFSFLADSQRWQTQLAGAVTSTPVKYRQLIIVAHSKGISALNAKTGAIVWQKELGNLSLETQYNWDSLQPDPVITDDNILFAFGNQLLLLDAATGSEQWQKTLPVAISATPTIDDDDVYLAGASGEIIQVKLDNGQVRWQKKPANDMIQGPIAYANDTLYFSSRDGKIRSWSPETNKTRWTIDHGTSWVMAGPLLDKRQVLIGSSDSQLIQSIDSRTGNKRWEIFTGQNTYHKAIKSDGRYWFATGDAYGTHKPGQLIGVNAKGEAKLIVSLPSGALSQPVAGDDVIWVGTEDGTLLGIATQ